MMRLCSLPSFCGFGDHKFQTLRLSTTGCANSAKTRGLRLGHEAEIAGTSKLSPNAKGTKDRIREKLLVVEHSPSPYDTAWVALVPSPRFSQFPCFPECLDWILDNQHVDGSWSPHRHPSLMKDALSSTLACILALERWNVGEEHVKRGLQFIGSNIMCAVDKNLNSPIGFDIIFPSMISHAIEMGLDIPVHQTDIDAMYYIRDTELKRGYEENSEGWKTYLAFIAEGLNGYQDWQEVMRYQKKNGSLFDSPSTTAAALIYIHDAKALSYLHLLLQKFGSSVPTVYPRNIYTQLSIVDKLERLGIARYFNYEIKSVLERIHRCWIDNDEEITSDTVTCAMAFRILRLNGYEVSSDALAQFDELNQFQNSVEGHLRDMNTVLELYKASQIEILPNEEVLQKLNSWTSHFLKVETFSNVTQQNKGISQEVEYALEFPFHVNLERLEHRRSIELCNPESIRTLKASYIFDNKDFLEVAKEDFNFCQSIYRKELEHIDSWVKENKLDRLEFARQKQAYTFLCGAAAFFPPEMSDARFSYVTAGVLVTVLDDFFDEASSSEERVNLITLVRRWGENHDSEFISERVRIIFYALYNTVNELGAKASTLQKNNVTKHMIEIWHKYLESIMKETEWTEKNVVPTMDEYMEVGAISFGFEQMLLATLYFVEPELSEDVMKGQECQKLLMLTSTCARLLNDIQSFKREYEQGKLNSVALCFLQNRGSISEDEAKSEMTSICNSTRRELLRMVVLKEGSVVPASCKIVFWYLTKVAHLFYRKTDGYSSPEEMVPALDALLYQPLRLATNVK